MSVWWYEKNGDKAGPVEVEELKILLVRNDINLETLVWKEGMSEWCELKATSELQSLQNAIPPSLKTKTSDIVPEETIIGSQVEKLETHVTNPIKDKGSQKIPNLEPQQQEITKPKDIRVTRFIARSFDLLWESLVVFTPFLLMPFFIGQSYIELIDSYIHDEVLRLITYEVVFPVTILFFALILDSATHTVFGNTPGKALLKLKVVDSEKDKLAYATHMKRNLGFMVQGVGLNISLLALVAPLYQFFRMKKGRSASYDEKAGYQILSENLTALRKFVFILLLIFAFVIFGYSAYKSGLANSMQKSVEIESTQSSIESIFHPKYTTWVNPETNLSTDILSSWRYQQGTADDGSVFYSFDSDSEQSNIIVGIEIDPTYFMNLEMYTIGYLMAMNSVFEFKDKGEYSTNEEGIEFWLGTGHLKGEENDHSVTVFIEKRNNRFWRTIITEYPPYEKDESEIDQMLNFLWATFK